MNHSAIALNPLHKLGALAQSAFSPSNFKAYHSIYIYIYHTRDFILISLTVFLESLSIGGLYAVLFYHGEPIPLKTYH